MFRLLLRNACTASRPSLFPALPSHYPAVGRLDMGKKLGRDMAVAADPNWTKEYSMPYSVMISNGLEEKRGGGALASRADEAGWASA